MYKFLKKDNQQADELDLPSLSSHTWKGKLDVRNFQEKAFWHVENCCSRKLNRVPQMQNLALGCPVLHFNTTKIVKKLISKENAFWCNERKGKLRQFCICTNF